MNTINFIAVGVSAIVSYAISFVWYMLLFRAPYVAGLGKTAEAMAKGPNAIHASVLQLIGNFALAYAFAWLMGRLGYTTVAQALVLALIVWAGFVAAVIGPMYAFEAFSFKFFLINSGSVLVTLLITAIIIGAWK